MGRALIALILSSQDRASHPFGVAYNVPLGMANCANVLMEDGALWNLETSASLEETLWDVKRRFGPGDSAECDGYPQEVLPRRLILRHGRYIWPRR